MTPIAILDAALILALGGLVGFGLGHDIGRSRGLRDGRSGGRVRDFLPPPPLPRLHLHDHPAGLTYEDGLVEAAGRMRESGGLPHNSRGDREQ